MQQGNPLKGLLSLALTVVAAQGLAHAAAAQEVATVSAKGVEALIRSNAGSVVVVNFWATWCAPCLREFPDIIEFYNEHRDDGVEVIAISMNAADEMPDIEEFLGEFKPPFPVYRAATQDSAFYETVLDGWYGEMPTTVIYDVDGNRARVHKKPLTYDELAADVGALLASR